MPDELLGAWLLRIAALYGLSLSMLLARLGAHPTPTASRAHWFAVSGAVLDLEALASALHRSPRELTAMAAPACRPRWPQELGVCTRCLQDASMAAHPVTWYRRWMLPLATVCAVHKVWLRPVATSALARVHHAAGMADLVLRIGSADDSHVDDPTWVDDALWLQRLFLARPVLAPWGTTTQRQLLRIVTALSRMLVSGGAATGDFAHLPGQADGLVKDFAVDTERGERVHQLLPVRMRHRQQLFGAVGHLLRHPSACRLPASMKKQLTAASLVDWPIRALEWICPQAAELVRWRDALRNEMGVYPRYFKACSALLTPVT